jgi:hypothetical protein
MGSHRTQRLTRIPSTIRTHKEMPSYPCNIGKKRPIKTIDGRILHWKIEEEIVRRQSRTNGKLIVFQKMRCLEDNRIEFRFGYYMIGLKPKAKGRWVWGQFCLFIPKEDLVVLIQEAKRKGWL